MNKYYRMSTFAPAPEPYILDWIRQLGSTGDDRARSVAIDSNNNVYITGYTGSSLDGTNAGANDAFLAKYDSTGIKVWTRQLGSTVIEVANSVAIDSNNNVYITGYTAGSLDGTNAGSNDAFLAKYDSTGSIIWTRQLGSTGGDRANSVAIDSYNNVYITGVTAGSLDGTNAGIDDAFLVKYDSTGIKVWTRQLGSTTWDTALSVAIDSNNNVYITGYTAGSLYGTSAGSNDAYLAKYDSTGSIIWTRQLGSTASDVANSVAIDSNNNVYITGYTAGSLDGTNAGSNDACLAKYDSTGSIIWTRQLGSTGEDVAYDLAIDSYNNVYISGYTAGSLDVTNAGLYDAFLAKYDSTGSIIWTRQLGSTGSDVAWSVAIDSNNNVYITGSTAGSLDGTNAGSSDAFLAKYLGPAPAPAPTFAPADRNALDIAISAWIANAGSLTNGTAYNNVDINSWDVTAITDMSDLFFGKTTFNSNIGSWNVSNVTKMNSMFCAAPAFDQNIRTWHVGQWSNLTGMFSGATAMNNNRGASITPVYTWFDDGHVPPAPTAPTTRDQLLFVFRAWAFDPIAAANKYGQPNTWNVSAVTDMSGGMGGFVPWNFNSDISSWNVSNVTNMSSMFQSASAFNQDISGWNVSNVTDMSIMFTFASAFDQNIRGWSVGPSTNLFMMFAGATAMLLRPGASETPSSSWFNQVSAPAPAPTPTFAPADRNALDIAISAWIANAGSLTNGTAYNNVDINSWDVTAITNMSNLFAFKTTFNGDISGWNVSNVTDTSGMFNEAYAFNQPIGSWNVSNVTSMSGMFGVAVAFNQPLNLWNVSMVTGMDYMFVYASAFDQDIRGWSVGPSTNLFNMFLDATAMLLRPGASETPSSSWFNQTGAPAPAPTPTFAPADRYALDMAISAWIANAGSLTNGSAYNNVDINSWNVTAITNMSDLFLGKTTFNSNIGSWNVSNVTNMSNMFCAAPAFDQNIRTWHVGQWSNLTGMFSSATAMNNNRDASITPLYTWFDDGHVPPALTGPTTRDQLLFVFSAWASDPIAAANTYGQPNTWNVSAVTDMSGDMMGGFVPWNFNADISSWNVSNVTNMSGMFQYRSAFDQNIRGWSVGPSTNLFNMFLGATAMLLRPGASETPPASWFNQVSAPAPANTPAVGHVMISGDLTHGETLMALHTLTDVDGLGEVSRKWKKNGVEIIGAVGYTYTLTPDDIGAKISVTVSYTDGSGGPESKTSDETYPIQPIRPGYSLKTKGIGSVTPTPPVNGKINIASVHELALTTSNDAIALSAMTSVEKHSFVKHNVSALLAKYTPSLGSDKLHVSKSLLPFAVTSSLSDTVELIDAKSSSVASPHVHIREASAGAVYIDTVPGNSVTLTYSPDTIAITHTSDSAFSVAINGGAAVNKSIGDKILLQKVVLTLGSITAAPNNLPVFVQNAPTTVYAGASYSHTVSVSDADNDTFTVTAPILPSWLTFSAGTLSSSSVPSAVVGSHAVQLLAQDIWGGQTYYDFTITVQNVPVTGTEGDAIKFVLPTLNASFELTQALSILGEYTAPDAYALPTITLSMSASLFNDGLFRLKLTDSNIHTLANPATEAVYHSEKITYYANQAKFPELKNTGNVLLKDLPVINGATVPAKRLRQRVPDVDGLAASMVHELAYQAIGVSLMDDQLDNGVALKASIDQYLTVALPAFVRVQLANCDGKTQNLDGTTDLETRANVSRELFMQIVESVVGGVDPVTGNAKSSRLNSLFAESNLAAPETYGIKFIAGDTLRFSITIAPRSIDGEGVTAEDIDYIVDGVQHAKQEARTVELVITMV